MLRVQHYGLRVWWEGSPFVFCFTRWQKIPPFFFPNPFCHNLLPLQCRGHPLSPDGGAWTDAPHLLWKKMARRQIQLRQLFNFWFTCVLFVLFPRKSFAKNVCEAVQSLEISPTAPPNERRTITRAEKNCPEELKKCILRLGGNGNIC